MIPTMAKNTPRDQVWQFVIGETVQERNKVTSSFVAEEIGVSERTARDALKSMPFLESRKIPDNRVIYELDSPEYFEHVDE